MHKKRWLLHRNLHEDSLSEKTLNKSNRTSPMNSAIIKENEWNQLKMQSDAGFDNSS